MISRKYEGEENENMDFETLKDFLNELQNVVKDLDEKFQQIAFKCVLKQFLEIELGKNNHQEPLKPHLEKQEKDKQQPTASDEGDISKLTLPELIKKANSNSYTDNALIIAFEFTLKNKFQPFNLEIIREGFSNALVPKPKNLSDTLNLLIKRGHLRKSVNDVDNKKGFEITNTGLEYVKGLLKK